MPYTIKSGDNLTKIANQFGTTIQQIMSLNPSITNPNLIYAGANLVLPSDKTSQPAPVANPAVPAPAPAPTPAAPAPVPAPAAVVTPTPTPAPAQQAATRPNFVAAGDQWWAGMTQEDYNKSLQPGGANYKGQTPATPTTPAATPTTPQTPATPTTPQTTGQPYVIQSGDTLSALAAKYGTTVGALMAANPQIKDPNKIYAGQTLNIPGSGTSSGTPPATTTPPATGGSGASVQVTPTPDTNNDGVINEVDIATNTRNEIYKKYGIDTAVHNWETNPTKSYEDVYKEIFNTLNLGEVQKKVNDVIAQIDQANKDFQTATGNINENPWISEAGRVGKIAKLQQSYEMTINRLQGTQTLLENALNRGKDEAKSIADRSISTFNQQRSFQKEELDLLISRAEADIAAADKGRETQRSIDTPGKKTFTNIREVNGGLYDLETGSWVTQPKSTVTSTTTNSSEIGKTTPTTGSIQNDVQAILEGRNTMYNIRQTMGRTNSAAAYMQQIRDAITKVDPNFDFVASDAGGKSVSTSYVQRATAAINAVLPNIDIINELSNQVSRLGVKGVDLLLQKTALQIGNVKVSNFHQAQKLIADEIGVALGAGTVSDMKLQLGFDVTDPNVTQEVFASNMGLVREFLNNRADALKGLRYKSSTTGGGSSLNPDDIVHTLQTYAGKDGKVSPDDWKKMKDLFTQNGGSTQEFDQQYSQFKNPNNPYYK